MAVTAAIVIAFATLVVSSTLDGGASEAMPGGKAMQGDEMP